MNLTPWHPPHMKPARIGYYQTKLKGNNVWAQAGTLNWNGHYWMWRGTKAAHQFRQWRGLAAQGSKG